MESYKKLLLGNKAWVKEKTALKPTYFQELAKDQRPDFLWIGCSDSRVPAEDITGTQPGEIFVHRNIANLVISTDVNLLSVLQYAVDYLKVKHIIVCGHYGCGGVRAAMTNQRFGILNKWLRQIKDVYARNQDQIRSAPTEDARVERLVELNVREQVMNLARTEIVQHAWYTEARPMLHGWVYGLNDGFLKPMVEMGPNSEIDSIYRFDFADRRAPQPSATETAQRAVTASDRRT